ncbi:efflux RND transporter periplasmic adaptor subunit [Shewanella sp. CG12_big_fil_rev_8_21_14_0_65_47_15]|uniref:efflux RND transporter periplasmic adaptor subunit n=1 Tax=Shewanella sp. CG12_big_fil_rev_8_21_14_0_65_47_15 TaxID=1975537 RepID=UPI000CBC9EFA|nr:efflux RND transporter periplasmic adaptor subunit [Shewanella sp. CG12_big_fil_rev_8_21_14_0_65_47_15]PIW61498.1 MAG: efflux transporter periplasmic adaptor subunit [Shewanella sp. CG12_big_fil_rev_8_21_14_0_65_47_15]
MFKQSAPKQIRSTWDIPLKSPPQHLPRTSLFAQSVVLLASLFIFVPMASLAVDKVDTTPVTVEAIREAALADVVKEVGKINAIDSAILNFNASEKISAIHFSNGDNVTKGQVIAEQDNTKAKADLDKAKSTLALAKTKLERIEDLLIKEPFALAKQDVDELRENVNLADADVRQKQATMKDYLIIAPFDGQLTSFSQSIGSQIGAGTALVTLYSLHPVEVRYAISQKDLGKAQKGQGVDVTVEAYGNKVFKGLVNYVAPAVDESSGRVEIHATLDNPEFKLAPGMFANIKQFYSHDIKHLLVPQNSIIANNDERFVWLVRGDSAVKQVVKLAQNTNDGYAVVAEGLTEGDLVVKTGMQNLKADSKIKVIQDKNTLEDIASASPNPKASVDTEPSASTSLNPNPNPNPDTSTNTSSSSGGAN